MYDKAFFEWELELKKAQAEKRSPDFSLRPKEPVRKLLTLSPNVSKSMLISALEESGQAGVLHQCYGAGHGVGSYPE